MVRTALDAQGFTTLGLLDATTLGEVRDLVEGLDLDPDEPYWASSVHADRSVARRVDQALKTLWGPRLEAHLPGHEPFLAAVIAKGASGGRVGLHPDWTYTDERVHRARVAWCPLVDTDEDAGAMVVLPGSHGRLRGLRGSGGFASPVDGIEEDLWAAHVQTVPLAAGEAVVWDAALLHGSWPNRSDRWRPAVAIAVAPTGADLVHFHRGQDGAVEGFVIEEAHYTTAPYAGRPVGAPRIEAWDDPVAPHRLEDLVDP